MRKSHVLSTTAGEVELQECRLAVGNRTWSIHHTAAVVTHAEESRFLKEGALPYGVALWPAAIALAHEIALRASEFRAQSVLELGAGTGLPGIVAAGLGATVVQTDRQELALHLCRHNGEMNHVEGVVYRQTDWTAWDDTKRYHWIIAADVLYAADNHPHLQAIFENNLTGNGRVLIADPYRADSIPLLDRLELGGWKVTHSRWSIGEGAEKRPIGIYELMPPG